MRAVIVLLALLLSVPAIADEAALGKLRWCWCRVGDRGTPDERRAPQCAARMVMWTCDEHVLCDEPRQHDYEGKRTSAEQTACWRRNQQRTAKAGR